MSGTVTPCPVDLEDGLSRVGDDREFYKELLDLFLSDAMERVDAIRAAVAAGESEQLTRVAHGMKGAAANLSAVAVRDTAYELEKLGRAGTPQQAGTLVDELAHAVGQLAEFTRSF